MDTMTDELRCGMERRFEDCGCTCGCCFCRREWPEQNFFINRTTPSGRTIMTKEERERMDFPYPPEPDL